MKMKFWLVCLAVSLFGLIACTKEEARVPSSSTSQLATSTASSSQVSVVTSNWPTGPEGAVISAEPAEDGGLDLTYDSGDMLSMDAAGKSFWMRLGQDMSVTYDETTYTISHVEIIVQRLPDGSQTIATQVGQTADIKPDGRVTLSPKIGVTKSGKLSDVAMADELESYLSPFGFSQPSDLDDYVEKVKATTLPVFEQFMP